MSSKQFLQPDINFSDDEDDTSLSARKISNQIKKTQTNKDAIKHPNTFYVEDDEDHLVLAEGAETLSDVVPGVSRGDSMSHDKVTAQAELLLGQMLVKHFKERPEHCVELIKIHRCEQALGLGGHVENQLSILPWHFLECNQLNDYDVKVPIYAHHTFYPVPLEVLT